MTNRPLNGAVDMLHTGMARFAALDFLVCNISPTQARP